MTWLMALSNSHLNSLSSKLTVQSHSVDCRCCLLILCAVLTLHNSVTLNVKYSVKYNLHSTINWVNSEGKY